MTEFLSFFPLISPSSSTAISLSFCPSLSLKMLPPSPSFLCFSSPSHSSTFLNFSQPLCLTLSSPSLHYLFSFLPSIPPSSYSTPAAAALPPRGREADPVLERQAYLDGEDGPGTGQGATYLRHPHLHPSHHLPVLQASAQRPVSPGHAV